MLTEFTQAANRVVDYLGNCLELASKCGDKTLCNTLSTLKTELENFTFNIAVVGDIKRGKSTLINTLLGRTDDVLSPVGVTICTSAIVKYRNYKAGMEHEPHAVVYYENAPGVGRRVAYEDLRGLISQKSNPDNVKGVRVIEVYGDFPLLGKCCLVDTPGANAAIERHGEMVSEFLPSADAIIMPVMAGQAMTDSEQQMLRQLSSNSKRRIFYVLTKIDRTAEEERSKVLAWVQNCIREAGMPDPETIYHVACKKVFDAMKAGESEERVQALRKEWGLERLERDLGDFMLRQSSEGRALVDRMNQAMTLVKTSMETRRKSNEALIATHDVSAEDIEKECQRIRDEFTDYQKEMKKSLARFSSRWDKEVTRSLDDLENRVDDIVDTIRDAVKRMSLFSLFSVSSTIATKIRPHIVAAVDRLETRLTPLIDRLDKDFEETCTLYAKRVEPSPIVETLGALASIGGSAATVIGVSLPAIQSVLAAANAYIAAAGATATASASSGLLVSIGGWLVGSGSVVAAETAQATAWAALVSTVTGAIVPVAIGIAALSVTGPVARWFVKARIPSTVEDSVAKVRDNLKQQLEKWKEEIVCHSEEVLEDQREEMEKKLEALSGKLRALDPAAREQARQENENIQALLEGGADISTTIICLPCNQD